MCHYGQRDTCLFHPESYRYNKFSNLHIKYARDAAESFEENRISSDFGKNINEHRYFVRAKNS